MNAFHKRVESIIPTLEQCVEIPAGMFQNTVFIWRDREIGAVPDMNIKALRELYGTGIIYPAPTLEEIIEDLGNYNIRFLEEHMLIDGKLYHYPTEATSALDLWFQVYKEHKRTVGGAW